MSGRKKKKRKSQQKNLVPQPPINSPDQSPPQISIPELQPLPIKAAWIHMVFVLLALITIYAFTMPRTVTLEDDGEFISAVYYAGVAHPPGYPLYVLLSYPFTLLPVLSMAFRVHLASAFFGAATCAVVWWAIRALVPNTIIAYISALTLGVSRVFWSQSIIAEVYTLNTFLLFTLLSLSLAYIHHRKAMYLLFMALIFGMGLSNHWPLFLLSLPCVILILFPLRRQIIQDFVKHPIFFILLILPGLVPYAWMIIRSRNQPELSFYGTLNTWQDVMFYVFRSGYSGLESSPTAGFEDKIKFGLFLLKQSMFQYTLPGTLIILTGFIAQWKRWKLFVSAGFAVGYLFTALVLVTLIGFDYNYLQRAIFSVYPLVPYGIMSFWFALGLFFICERISSLFSVRLIVPASILGPVILIFIFLTNIGMNSRSDYSFAKDYAMTLLNSFDKNAVVFTHGDFDTCTMGYFHFVEGVRPDIGLFNEQGLGISLDGRIFDPAKTSNSKKENLIIDYVNRSERPVYFIYRTPPTISDEDYGFYMKINRKKTKTTSFMLDKELLELFHRVINNTEIYDQWTVWCRQNFIGHFTRVLTAYVDLNPGNPPVNLQEALEKACGYFHGLMARTKLNETQSAVEPSILLDWINKAETLTDETIGKKDYAMLYLIKGKVLKKLGRRNEAVQAFKKSVEFYGHPESKAFDELKALE